MLGVFRGDGIGPELVDGCISLLEILGTRGGRRFDLRFGGEIGDESSKRWGKPLTEEAVAFADGIFKEGGALFCGAGGGRFVYEMRARFDLFCKMNPIHGYPELSGTGRVRALEGDPIDLLVVRENLGGLYHPEEETGAGDAGEKRVKTSFFTSEAQVRELLRVACLAATARQGRLCIVVKRAGIPAASRLWMNVAEEEAAIQGIDLEVQDIDYAAYRIVQDPRRFDVLATPNCFGDIMADLGGLLCGSRGMTFGSSHSHNGAAVYQTNHGAAHDLVGKGEANPAGQIFSLALMLADHYGMEAEGRALVDAVREVWRAGWRTPDIFEPGCRALSTAEMFAEVGRQLSGLKFPTSDH
ncbi:MAG: isocitrate/isopropylmalate family dehydrogenase [Verrucomicrobiales bacterium]